MVNFLYLRNYAYREVDPQPAFKDGRPNPHLHWHVLPRYRLPVAFEGVVFEDASFGDQTNQVARTIPASLRERVVERLREQLPVS